MSSVFGKLRRTNTSSGKKSGNAINPGGNAANHLSASKYALRCKLILELRADIENLDLDTDDIKFDFPRLVVIGDQSSGKSSLVEAVSGINVPRDSGTCTRCPMECFMRSTTDLQWSCSISIQTGFGSVPFAPAIYERSSVELWIRRAQAAILSPHRSHNEFLNKSEHELKSEVDPNRLQFSKKSVLVEIRDPQSPDLDFVDLPGIVHAVDPPSLGEDVINLVEKFIASENTIILIAMPMTSDWQIQAAVRLARDADPNGDRTIGVLTKPDALQDGDIGSRETWKKILANEDPDRKTKHGYYCVRLPNDRERKKGITRDEALNLATDFFSSCAPWNEMDDKSRCGVPNFVKNISVLLVEHIEKYLPVLEKQVNHLLDVCLKEIAGLPSLLDKAPSTEIHLRISAFCQAFKDAVFGRDNRHFVQKNKLRYSVFSQDISATEPKYITSGFESARSIQESEPSILASELGQQSDSKSVVAIPTIESLTLEDVRRVKEGTITWELPPHVPFDATIVLVNRYTSKWEDPSLKCFDDVVANSIKFEKSLLKTHFGQYGELLRFVRKLTTQERDRCEEDARKTLKKILQFESKPLFTQNNAFLNSERTKWLHAYDFTSTKWSISYYRLRYEKYIQELELMADSYAYFQVAHKRIIDYVPLTIGHELNQAFVNNLEVLLFASITRESAIPGRLEELVREDSAMAKRRQRLEIRKRDLLKIKQKINDFWSLSNASDQTHTPGSSARRNSFHSEYYSPAE